MIARVLTTNSTTAVRTISRGLCIATSGHGEEEEVVYWIAASFRLRRQINGSLSSLLWPSVSHLRAAFPTGRRSCEDRLFSVLPVCDRHGHSPVPSPNRSMRSLAVAYCSKLLTYARPVEHSQALYRVLGPWPPRGSDQRPIASKGTAISGPFGEKSNALSKFRRNTSAPRYRQAGYSHTYSSSHLHCRNGCMAVAKNLNAGPQP